MIMMKKRTGIPKLLLAGALLLAVLACGLLPGQAGVPAGDASSGGSSNGNGPLVDAPGVAVITLTTSETGAGLKPLLAWEPVEEAAEYQVTVYTPGKEPYWAWHGEATSVYLGGGDTPPPEDSVGPALAEGMWWAVLAFDADGRIVGSSVLGQISP